MSDIYIFGASGYARETAILIQEMNEYSLKAFIDIKDSEDFIKVNNLFYPIISEDTFLEKCKGRKIKAVIAIADTKITEKIIHKFQDICLFPNIIHPSSTIHGRYDLGIGNVISYNCVFTDNITIGSFNRFNVGVSVGHDVVIGDNNQFNPSCKISGNVVIGDANLFGVNSVVLQGVQICDNNTIGASSLILKKINIPGTYIGVPAKRFKF